MVFGRKKPPKIDTIEKVSEYINKVDNLYQIEESYNIIKNSDIKVHPVDHVYESMNVDIEILKDLNELRIINNYIANTHGKRHKFKLNIDTIYKVNYKDIQFDELKNKIGNTELLIHGSRMTNWCSIIKNGFHLNPKILGAHITGKMFGYGIYFTNSSSKSAQYCGITEKGTHKICIMFAEVIIGNSKRKLSADPFFEKCHLDNKYNSVWGMGKITPKQGEYLGDMYIPNGTLHKSDKNSVLHYDEKVIYDTKQYKIKYMVLLDIEN